MEHATHMLAAYSELAIAIVSFYGCGAAVLNTHFGRVFLPVGKPFGIFKNNNFLYIEDRHQVNKNLLDDGHFYINTLRYL